LIFKQRSRKEAEDAAKKAAEKKEQERKQKEQGEDWKVSFWIVWVCRFLAK
jgi:hypothetical protein